MNLVLFEKVFENVFSIPPISVDSGRDFSNAVLIGTKLRSSLNDDTLDKFLKSYNQESSQLNCTNLKSNISLCASIFV